jgi:hypothetical protein
MRRNIQRKNEQEFYIFKMYVFINENPNHYFILLSKFRGEICAREIYKQSLWSG